MTSRELFDHAVFAVFGLGFLGLQLVFFWDVGGLHL
jgi:hypothetical protein